jgi:hypothetical protein
MFLSRACHDPLLPTRHSAAVRAFLFQSRRDPLLVAFSRDASGKNLPSKLGPWIKLEGAPISVGGEIAGIGSTDPVIADIEEQGFFVGRTKVVGTGFGH